MASAQHTTFSRKDVLRHNTREDCWLIVKDAVYDLTPFLRDHPGGMDILLSRAGEDATSFFMGKHGRNPAVIKQLERYRIGELPESERLPVSDYDEPFLLELIDRSYKEKLYHIPKARKRQFRIIRTVNFVLFFTLSGLALYGGLPWWISAALVFVQAIIGTSLFGLVAHEATHRNYPKNKTGKILLSATWPVCWPFISENPLRFEHNSHHVKIGDPEYDYEVAAFAGFIRYSGLITPGFLTRYQHKLAKYLYPFYANIITTVGGFRSPFWGDHNRQVILEHNLSILTTITYYIILPAVFGPENAWWYLSLYLVYQCVLFYGIYVGAAINHFVPSILRPIPEAQHNKFGYYVCHNTTNFCAERSFWNWYTGGFNVQIEHHLIPFVPVENLQRMIPIVRELCAKYGYPYHNYGTVKALWDDHYEYLRILSDNSDPAVLATERANKASYQAR